MSSLIHTTDSLDGRFSKSRDIAVHNGALRPKFAPSFSSRFFLLPSLPPARDCNIPHGCRTRRRTTWHTRYPRVCDKKGPRRAKAGPSLVLVLLLRLYRAAPRPSPSSTKFVLPVAFPHADRKRQARRIPPPRFGTRTRNLFARRQVAYGAVLISVRVSGPPSIVGFDAICARARPPAAHRAAGLFVVNFCSVASVFSSIETFRWNSLLTPSLASLTPASINGNLNAPAY